MLTSAKGIDRVETADSVWKLLTVLKVFSMCPEGVDCSQVLLSVYSIALTWADPVVKG